jgi:hypothetical protein
VWTSPACALATSQTLYLSSGNRIEDEIYVMPGKVIRLGQILELFNIGMGVSGKGVKTFFNLGAVREREGNVNLDNALCTYHLP